MVLDIDEAAMAISRPPKPPINTKHTNHLSQNLVFIP
jgi:hypothetical protein